MRIFLIGFMGCGKSTKAKQLANRLNYPVMDFDALIEEREGKTIAAYFAEHGEKAFRDTEAYHLRSSPFPINCVIATGGGLPCYFENIDWMNYRGITVYLKMEPAALVSRLHNRQKRPLIASMDDEQLLAFIEKKLAEREPFYNQAKLVINALDLDVETLEKRIMEVDQLSDDD